MFKRSLLVILALAFAVTAITANDDNTKFRRHGPRGDHMELGQGPGGFGLDSWLLPGKWWKIPKVKEELALTDNQIVKLDDLFLQHKTEMIDIKADLEKKQLEVSNLFDKDGSDDAAILEKVDDLIAARGVMQKSYVKMLLAMKKVLVPDQIRKLKDLHAQARTRIMHRQFKEKQDRAREQSPPSPQ